LPRPSSARFRCFSPAHRCDHFAERRRNSRHPQRNLAAHAHPCTCCLCRRGFQGEGSAQEVARAIKFLNDFHARALSEGRIDAGIDVMIVGRGGGSIEDLWLSMKKSWRGQFDHRRSTVISAVATKPTSPSLILSPICARPRPRPPLRLSAAHEAQLCSLPRTPWLPNLARSIRFRISGARNDVQELGALAGFRCGDVDDCVTR